jgi:hypothetical protein
MGEMPVPTVAHELSPADDSVTIFQSLAVRKPTEKRGQPTKDEIT